MIVMDLIDTETHCTKLAEIDSVRQSKEIDSALVLNLRSYAVETFRIGTENISSQHISHLFDEGIAWIVDAIER
jgi:hypothetical protein